MNIIKFYDTLFILNNNKLKQRYEFEYSASMTGSTVFGNSNFAVPSIRK
jgi:hypothetical protein